MKIGLIGFPFSGKTTLFTALSAGHSHEGVASVPLPDPRLETLVALVHPKKVTPVHLEWHDDLPDLKPGSSSGVKETMSAACKMEVLLLVLRLFDSPFAPYHAAIDPVRDLRFWLEESILYDLQRVENRLERLGKLFQSHKETAADRAEAFLLDQVKESLQAGIPIRQLELASEARTRLSGFELLSTRPLIVLANLSESRLGQQEQDPLFQALQLQCEASQLPLFSLCATFERDLLTLPPEEHVEFLSMVGLEKPLVPELMRFVFDQLRLLIFYTVVGEETRAWLLPREEATALKAAHTIHSDMARGFIRAEVCHFEDFVEAGGWQEAHHAGKTRLEGREYHLRDGDILQIRFKV